MRRLIFVRRKIQFSFFTSRRSGCPYCFFVFSFVSSHAHHFRNETITHIPQTNDDGGSIYHLNESNSRKLFRIYCDLKMILRTKNGFFANGCWLLWRDNIDIDAPVKFPVFQRMRMWRAYPIIWSGKWILVECQRCVTCSLHASCIKNKQMESGKNANVKFRVFLFGFFFQFI